MTRDEVKVGDRVRIANDRLALLGLTGIVVGLTPIVSGPGSQTRILVLWDNNHRVGAPWLNDLESAATGLDVMLKVAFGE